MKRSPFFAIIFCICFSSCAPRITTKITKRYAALPSTDKVSVLNLTDSIPSRAEEIGTVKIGDTGFTTDCDYETVINKAKKEALKSGGNTIKIIDHKTPSIIGSSCHRITAKILRIDSLRIAQQPSPGEYMRNTIVLKNGDSISCNITNIDKKNIHYEQMNPEGVSKKSVLLNDVSRYDTSDQATLNTLEPINLPFSKYRLSAYGGMSFRTASIANEIQGDLRTYLEGLKKGYGFGADASYYFSEQYGAGLKFYLTNASNQINNITAIAPDGSKVTGLMKDDITTYFIGPVFSERSVSQNGRNSLTANLGLGYVAFQNDAVFINMIKITGSTVGLAGDIGYDIGISKNYSVGIQASYLLASISEITYDFGSEKRTIQLDKDHSESLNRFDITLAIRYNSGE